MKRFSWLCMLLAVSVFSVATLGCGGTAEDTKKPAEEKKVDAGMDDTKTDKGEMEGGTEPAPADTGTEPAPADTGTEKKEDGSAAADPASDLNINLDVSVDKTSDQPGA